MSPAAEPSGGQNEAERRYEARMLCADLVDLHWIDKAGTAKRAIANLEDISSSGACLQLEIPLPLRTTVEMTHPGGRLSGYVRYCVYREIGYFVGIQFEDGSRWSRRVFKPMHMLDPRGLLHGAEPDRDGNSPHHPLPMTIQ